MRLHSARVPGIARQMVDLLIQAKDIETEAPREVQADLEAVLAQYVRDEQEVTERARDLVATRGMAAGEVARTKRLLAEQRGMKVGDEALDYLLGQLIEMLMMSTNVEEVYAEDVALRRQLRAPLRKEMDADDALEKEVRANLKHVREGTSTWDVEYRRMVEEVKRRRGLD